jgi:HSP20 family protein
MKPTPFNERTYSMAEKETSAIKPFDPIRELDLFRSLSSSWGSFPSLLRRFEEFPTRSAPLVDISEDDGHYVVTAELPGAKKDDVTVELEDNVLTIRGEKKSEREEKDEHRRYVERTYGSFSRSFSLPGNADPDRIDASIEHGVLTVTIGKREEAKPKTIAVK